MFKIVRVRIFMLYYSTFKTVDLGVVRADLFGSEILA